MIINNMISSERWVKAYGSNSSNVEVYAKDIDVIRKTVNDISHLYSDGEFIFDHSDTSEIKSGTSLGIKDTTPLPFLFKTYSSTFYAKGNNNTVFWKSSSIDENIIDIFDKYNHHKYITSNTNEFKIEEPYILFVLQDTYFFDFKLFAKILKWSKDNKRRIVFKNHPLMYNDFTFNKYWSVLETFDMTKYCTLINECNLDFAIDNAEKVWSFSSGVTLSALLRGKPTATFMNSDYNPLVKMCSSIEEADAVRYPNEEELFRFLSWFYHRFTIDARSENVKDRFVELFDLFYKEKRSLEYILSIDWK